MKYISIFLGTILLFYFLYCSYIDDQSSDYERIADKITNQTAENLEKAYEGLYLIGIGGRMMNDIQMMAMSFNYYQEVDLDKARELMLVIIDEYLTAINSDESVRPYLHDNPFTAKNIGIRIWVRKPDGSNLPLDKIEYFSAINGVLKYYITGEEKQSENLLCKETYEEAKLS